VSEIEQRTTTRRWILLGLAIAIPLGAVALYFAVLAPPPPPAPVAAAPRGAGPAGLPADHPPIGGAGAAAPEGERAHPQMGSTGRAVRVPDSVKGKWRAVKLQVETKGGGSPPQTITLGLGAEAVVAGSKLKLRAEEFLPALQVKGNEITSGSNEPANPAVLMTIWEDGKQVFHGWLFSKFPDMQPFEHPTYRITLVEGVPAG
jgi:hypothetical protein